VCLFSYAVSWSVQAGRWWLTSLLLVALTVMIAVAVRRYSGPSERFAGWADVRREAVHVSPLFNALVRASEVGSRGDLAAAVEIVDGVAAHPATARLPLLAANVAMVRCDLAVAQGDLESAEREAVAVVRFHEQGTNRSALSESVEKLGKVQLLLGRNQDAYRTFTRALEAGGPKMYGMSRVRIELYLANIAVDDTDIPRAVEHATVARKLAITYKCRVQQISACDMLAILAVAESRLDDAARWTAEADGMFRYRDCSLPHLVRHLVATALVAGARGESESALAAYVRMMRGVAELRAGWGWRDAQAYYVDLYSEHEVAAFSLAHDLHLRADRTALDSFALLLDLGNRTALRRMLRGGLAVEGPADLETAGMADIVGLLSTIARREGTMAGESAAAAAVSTPDGADETGRREAGQAYERLETLVSLRFRQAMEAGSEEAATDARQCAARWRTHVLQTRLVTDGASAYVVGLWTTPDGEREPYVHRVEADGARLLGEVAGLTDHLPGGGAGTEAPQPPSPDTTGTDGVRAEAPNWKQTPLFFHLRRGDAATWGELALLLLPPGLIALLRGTDPDADVPKLLLVPDTSLWRVPWAALRVEPRHAEGYLMDRAVLAMLPSLSLVSGETPVEPGHETPAKSAFAYLAGVHPEGLALEKKALDTAFGGNVTYATQPAELLALLDPAGPRLSVGVASVHGNSRPGLAHALTLARRSELSAARMLTLRFPRTLMINACLSAELDERRGTDPLGIPTVALCRGAETVIGGIYPLPDGRATKPEYSHPTSRILTVLYQLIAEGVPPSTALRAAQRRWRGEVGLTPPWLWAGLVSITAQFDDHHRISGQQGRSQDAHRGVRGPHNARRAVD
jgi:hypothetical protein